MQFSNLPPVVKNLLILNILFYLPNVFFSEAVFNNQVISHFALFYFDSPFFKPWQIITYMFLHGSIWHILFNMFALFSFGPIVEYSVGSKKFFNLYFICGIGAVAFQMLIQALEVHHFTGHFTIPADFQTLDPSVIEKLKDVYSTPIVGASGAIFGVLVAFGMLFPDLELMILFIPVPVKAKYIIPCYVVLEIYSSINQSQGDNVAHLAHIGGAILGFLVVKFWNLQRT
jgi:membrane associated rhomboid family serine protease